MDTSWLFCMPLAASLMLVQPLLAPAQNTTSSPAGPDSSPATAALRKDIASREDAAVAAFWTGIAERGAPLIEPVPGDDQESLVTFLWRGDAETRNVVIFDGVAGFDANDRMVQVAHTSVWYRTYKVRNDARFAYNLSPNDSLVSVNSIKDDAEMEKRLASFRVDPLNPHRCPGTFNKGESSYVELPAARASVLSYSTPPGSRGSTTARSFSSKLLQNQRTIWIYTPAGFQASSQRAPLLVFFDGDRNIAWVPAILDALIDQKRVPPAVAVLIEHPTKAARTSDLTCSERFSEFLATELVPWMRTNYNVTRDPRDTVVVGSSFGGLAAAFTSLRRPEIFGAVVSLSGSFWWKPPDAGEPEWLAREFASLPRKNTRFYLEVGLMEDLAAQIATNRHMRDVLRAKGYEVGYREYNGGHAFLNWSDGTADGLCLLMGARRAQK